MKNNIRFILALFIATVSPLSFAAEAAAPAPQTETPKTSPKDMLLTFLLDKAKSYSGTIEEGVTKAVDFAKEQTPLVVAEFLTWRAWMHGMKWGIWALTFVVSASFFPYTWKNAKYDDSDFWGNLASFFNTVNWVTLIAGFVGSLIQLDHLFSLVQIWVAPRVYLIEEVSKMIK